MKKNTQTTKDGYIGIDKIIPYEKNAKKHPKKQIEKVANSIQEFGFNQPIVIDQHNVIIVGHGRYAAAKYLGMREVPIIQVNLTPEKASAYRLADNKLNESDWDMDLVISELKELDELGYDISLTGFDNDLLLDLKDKDDEIPETPITPLSKIGDVYELGTHRVMCGSATDSENVQTLTGGVMADMVFTDPPYNVDYSGNGKNTKNKILNDKMGDSDFIEFLTKSFESFAQCTKKGAGFYVFHSPTTQVEFTVALENNGIEIKNQLIWNKPHAGLGMGDYRWKHEPFFYAGFKKSKINFYGDRTHTSIVTIPETEEGMLKWVRTQKEAEKNGKTTIWTMKREPVAGYVHPTQKPVELIMYALTNSSKEGDIVLDLFGGSGATMVACEKMGRTAYIMELDPKYIDVIVERYVGYTGIRSIVKNGKVIQW